MPLAWLLAARLATRIGHLMEAHTKDPATELDFRFQVDTQCHCYAVPGCGARAAWAGGEAQRRPRRPHSAWLRCLLPPSPSAWLRPAPPGLVRIQTQHDRAKNAKEPEATATVRAGYIVAPALAGVHTTLPTPATAASFELAPARHRAVHDQVHLQVRGVPQVDDAGDSI
jgi:hypothetical protein